MKKIIKNTKFSQKSKIFSKIQNFLKNTKSSQKYKIFSKNEKNKTHFHPLN